MDTQDHATFAAPLAETSIDEVRERKAPRQTAFQPQKAEAPSQERARPETQVTAARSRSPRRFLGFAALLAGLAAGGYYGYDYITVGRFLVSTNDAYVKADSTVIASKLSGYITDLAVVENQAVNKSDILARIDDRDFQNALQAALNKLATQDATIARLKEQAVAQQALIDQAKAQVVAAKANQLRTQTDFERAQTLAQQEFGSRKTLDQARADRDQANASVLSAEAAQKSAEASLGVIQAQIKEAEGTRAELQTAVDKARLDLSYTAIVAPFAGVVGNKAVQLGQYVQPGTRLMALIPLDTVYIEANYKETQLDRIRPGQPVDISVDAADGRDFKGTVESIAPSSGAQYSLLPPENATGNFTKIVQRVPVRIRLSPEALNSDVFRQGLSVTTYIDTRDFDNKQGGAKLASQKGQAEAK